MTTTTCDYCDAPDAPANMLNFDLALHQFSVATDARNAYDRARYNAVFGHPRGSQAVEELIQEAMSAFNVFNHITVRVCEPCRVADRHASDRDTPVLGVNCLDAEARAALCASATALGEADRVVDEADRNWRHPNTY